MRAWYASQERMDSRTKILAMDDRGELTITADGVTFHGRRHDLRIRATAVSRSRPAFAYWAWMLQIPVVAVMLVLAFSVSDVVGAGAVAGGVCGLAMGIVVNRAIRLVRVAGRDESGAPVVAYFHVSKGFGWGGMLGGNESLAAGLGAVIAASGSRSGVDRA